MDMIDFSKVTPCGGCCSDCEHFKNSECRSCIATGGERVFRGVKSTCDIFKCCKAHNVSFCGICSEFPCQWLVNTITWDENGIENLRKLKDEYIKVHNEECKS